MGPNTNGYLGGKRESSMGRQMRQGRGHRAGHTVTSVILGGTHWLMEVSGSSDTEDRAEAQLPLAYQQQGHLLTPLNKARSCSDVCGHGGRNILHTLL